MRLFILLTLFASINADVFSLSKNYTTVNLNLPGDTGEVLGFIRFDTNNLYIKSQSVKLLDSICWKLASEKAEYTISLIPHYFYGEEKENEFIGVCRAKIILEQLVNVGNVNRQNITIKDIGAYDKPIFLCTDGVLEAPEWLWNPGVRVVINRQSHVP